VQPSQLAAPSHGSTGGAAVVQAPLWHVRPAQQSLESAQTPELATQPQRPPVHSIMPQQSKSLMQVVLAAAQHTGAVGLGLQASPAQHSPAAAQLVPADEQEGVGFAHEPLSQVRPA
jgi:hypothetical protein